MDILMLKFKFLKIICYIVTLKIYIWNEIPDKAIKKNLTET